MNLRPDSVESRASGQGRAADESRRKREETEAEGTARELTAILSRSSGEFVETTLKARCDVVRVASWSIGGPAEMSGPPRTEIIRRASLGAGHRRIGPA